MSTPSAQRRPVPSTTAAWLALPAHARPIVRPADRPLSPRVVAMIDQADAEARDGRRHMRATLLILLLAACQVAAVILALALVAR